jgi:hypothetical protein
MELDGPLPYLQDPASDSVLSESKKSGMYMCIHDETFKTPDNQMELDSLPTARFNA